MGERFGVGRYPSSSLNLWFMIAQMYIDVALTAESYINVAAILGRARLPYKHEQVKGKLWFSWIKIKFRFLS